MAQHRHTSSTRSVCIPRAWKTATTRPCLPDDGVARECGREGAGLHSHGVPAPAPRLVEEIPDPAPMSSSPVPDGACRSSRASQPRAVSR